MSFTNKMLHIFHSVLASLLSGHSCNASRGPWGATEMGASRTGRWNKRGRWWVFLFFLMHGAGTGQGGRGVVGKGISAFSPGRSPSWDLSQLPLSVVTSLLLPKRALESPKMVCECVLTCVSMSAEWYYSRGNRAVTRLEDDPDYSKSTAFGRVSFPPPQLNNGADGYRTPMSVEIVPPDWMQIRPLAWGL